MFLWYTACLFRAEVSHTSRAPRFPLACFNFYYNCRFLLWRELVLTTLECNLRKLFSSQKNFLKYMRGWYCNLFKPKIPIYTTHRAGLISHYPYPTLLRSPFLPPPSLCSSIDFGGTEMTDVPEAR